MGRHFIDCKSYKCQVVIFFLFKLAMIPHILINTVSKYTLSLEEWNNTYLEKECSETQLH